MIDEFIITGIGRSYLEIEVIVDGVSHDLGLIGKDEVLSLTRKLESAVKDLGNYYFDDQ